MTVDQQAPSLPQALTRAAAAWYHLDVSLRNSRHAQPLF